MSMPSRRSLLSCVLGPVALTGALLGVNRASARSATPELVGIDGWLNTAGPLTIAGQRGKVVLVEFCTYTCINWRRTLPYVNRWHSQYGPHGLQIIGVHTPEFGFERVRPYVESAIRELEVRYPIAQDNEFQTWRAWDNQAWPSFYLLDRDERFVSFAKAREMPRRLSAPFAACSALRAPDRGNIQQTMPTCPALAHLRSISGPCITRPRTAHSRLGKARQPTPSPSSVVLN
jgi:thiol-disulfide isomerase/thioredoxin